MLSDRRVIGVETFYHPMSRIWHQQDGAETTVMEGEWTTTHRGEQRHKRRRELVHIVRYSCRRGAGGPLFCLQRHTNLMFRLIEGMDFKKGT